MSDYCIAVVTEHKTTGQLTDLKVYPTPYEFLSEHANGVDARDIHLMTLAIDGSDEGVLGMFDLPTQPDRRLLYMIGDDPKELQDTLRLTVYTHNEH